MIMIIIISMFTMIIIPMKYDNNYTNDYDDDFSNEI